MTRIKKIKTPYSSLFMIPSACIYILFFILPALIGFVFSFTDWNIHVDKINFIGFQNFVSIFSGRVARLAIQNTLYFAIVTTIGKNLLGLGMALLLNGAFRGRSFFRGVFFFPAVLSYIVVGLLFTSILHPAGILNQWLSSFGLGDVSVSWIADKNLVMHSIAAVEIWMWSGFHMAIYLAGLQTVPRSMIECSKLDGAGAVNVFRYVTFPLIMPSFNVNLIVAMIGGFKVFDQVFILTNGGPGYASEVIATQVYKTLGEGSWGYAASMNLVLFFFITVIAVALLLYLRRMEVEY